MTEIDLFKDTPHRSAAERREALSHRPMGDWSKYDAAYYDAPQGIYGGYRYDGRYAAAAKRMVEHYGLRSGARVLEVGCAKGFILAEFAKLGMTVRGYDASQYAIANCHPLVREKIAINTLSTVPRQHPGHDQRHEVLLAASGILPRLDFELG